jgi:hypothetical protein
MDVRVDVGTWRPFRLGRVGTKSYACRKGSLQVLRWAHQPLFTAEIATRLYKLDQRAFRPEQQVAQALVHLEKGGLVWRSGEYSRPKWQITPLGRKAWKQLGHMRYTALKRLTEPQIEPSAPLEPEWVDRVYVRKNPYGKHWFDLRVDPLRYTWVAGTIRREDIFRAILEKRLKEKTIAEVLRLAGQSCTVELKRERHQTLPHRGLLIAHEIATEIERKLNAE